MLNLPVALLYFMVSFLSPAQPGGMYEVKNGNVKFVSEAPLELIKAESRDLKGIINFSKNEFAFSVLIASFEGFNSPLQREHFNENYLESEIYPKATFTGKIIEDISDFHSGSVQVRAKGTFAVHGISRERIIPATLTWKNNEILLESRFFVPLEDHNISIPRVVHQKIAEEIKVDITAVFKIRS